MVRHTVLVLLLTLASCSQKEQAQSQSSNRPSNQPTLTDLCRSRVMHLLNTHPDQSIPQHIAPLNQAGKIQMDCGEMTADASFDPRNQLLKFNLKIFADSSLDDKLLYAVLVHEDRHIKDYFDGFYGVESMQCAGEGKPKCIEKFLEVEERAYVDEYAFTYKYYDKEKLIAQGVPPLATEDFQLSALNRIVNEQLDSLPLHTSNVSEVAKNYKQRRLKELNVQSLDPRN